MCPRAKPRNPVTSKSKAAKLWILLVGVNQYQDQAHLPSLQYSALDCQGLGEALKEATASFEQKEVIIHHDFVNQLPRLGNVQDSITRIVNTANAEDTILFYFSGHGILETTTQQVVLCLADTKTEELLATGLPLNDLLQQLSNCAASQQLVWLDACHSGGMTLRGTARVSLPDPGFQLVETLRHQAQESKGFYALLSCDQTQQSWEFPELGHGVFTYYLMRGLRGEAADAQGIIEADALYQYVYHQTLRYIDKTNQQIRLINQQKSCKSEKKLQSEFPLQTPKRIVEGFGKVVLGKRSQRNSDINPRQALVVDGGFKANSITLALSQVLQSEGDFDLRYFPQTNESWSGVKDAIKTCLSSHSTNQSDVEITTALIYLRGRVETNDTGESWLILQDDTRISRSWLRSILRNSVTAQQILILDCPGSNALAEWIDDLQLEEDRGQCLIAANSPLANPQQFAQAVLTTLQTADHQVELPIAAWITQLQLTFAGTEITPQVWLSGTQGVIEVLTSKHHDNNQLALDLGICPYMGLQAFGETNAEYFYGRKALIQKLLNQIHHKPSLAVVGASGSGKSSVVQAGLLAQLRQGKHIPGSDRWWLGCFRPGSQPIQALAKLLCDSNSKEAAVKELLQIEGLLYQGVEGFVQWLRTRLEPMVIITIDQFEELFTSAAERERQEFLELILGALNYAGDRFKLVLTIRADFVASCLAVPELAYILQKGSILVPPYLTEADYRSAIIKPAKQVGLTVEPGLTEVLLQDLDRSAGDLPLLQFVLQKLWALRENGELTLKAYQKLGGIKGALERQAQAVYELLDSESQDCARWIFLTLTQLGDGTEDTRRRVTKSELIVAKYPEVLVNKTLRILTDAKLLVVNLDDGTSLGQSRSNVNPPDDDELFLEAMRQEATVEVVHEILIRHWSSLRWWLEENRARLRSQRHIDDAALLWQQKSQHNDFLLKGVRLAEAEEIMIKYTDELSDTANEYIARCIDSRLAEQREVKKRLRKAQVTAIVLGILGLAATTFGIGAYRQKLITQLENVDSLNAIAEAQLLSNQQLESITTSIKAGKQFQKIGGLDKKLVGIDNWQTTKYQTTATLQQSIYGTQELNRLEGHSEQINTVSISDDASLIAGTSDDGAILVWNKLGELRKTINDKQAKANPINWNDNLKSDNHFFLAVDKLKAENKSHSASLVDESTIELRSKTNNQLVTQYEHSSPVNSVSLSLDSKLIATTTADGQINIWSQSGILRQTLTGHIGAVLDAKFFPIPGRSNNYKLVSTGVDKTVRIWQIFDRYANQLEGVNSIAASSISNIFATAGWDGTIKFWHKNIDDNQESAHDLSAHDDIISQIKYSPDGKFIASAAQDKTIKLWHTETDELIDIFRGHQDGVNSIAFSPDSRTLFSGSEDQTVKIWDISGKIQLVKTLEGHTDSVKTVTVSPDGKLISSAGYDNTIRIWNIAGELLQTIDAHKLAVTSLAFSSDSKTLVSGSWDNSLKLWEIANSGKSSNLLHTLTGHQDGVTSIRFNLDGTLIASGSGDRKIKLWNPKTGELIKTLQGHTSQINDLTFSSDNRSIISAEEQQGLFWWNFDMDNLVTQGCDRLHNYLNTNSSIKNNSKKLCQ